MGRRTKAGVGILLAMGLRGTSALGGGGGGGGGGGPVGGV